MRATRRPLRRFPPRSTLSDRSEMPASLTQLIGRRPRAGPRRRTRRARRRPCALRWLRRRRYGDLVEPEWVAGGYAWRNRSALRAPIVLTGHLKAGVLLGAVVVGVADEAIELGDAGVGVVDVAAHATRSATRASKFGTVTFNGCLLVGRVRLGCWWASRSSYPCSRVVARLATCQRGRAGWRRPRYGSRARSRWRWHVRPLRRWGGERRPGRRTQHPPSPARSGRRGACGGRGRLGASRHASPRPPARCSALAACSAFRRAARASTSYAVADTRAILEARPRHLMEARWMLPLLLGHARPKRSGSPGRRWTSTPAASPRSSRSVLVIAGDSSCRRPRRPTRATARSTCPHRSQRPSARTATGSSSSAATPSGSAGTQARHTAATIQLKQPKQYVAIVAKYLGHTDPDFTYRSYIHPLEDAEAQLAREMAELGR